ncbi:Transthyretin-like family protein [Aphelenchoides fujianensis]|nr:Transthyretin-like family protein [Aphelenchoides fujianensis]
MNQLLTAAVLALLVGKLTCNGKPASGVLVKLWDDDSGIDTDDLLGKTKTDSDGHFETHGYTDEILNIDPKSRPPSPDSYISNGKTPEKYYDAGTIELSGAPKGEARDCIH